MSKVYEWWADQLCINCNNKNEQCDCSNDFPTEPIKVNSSRKHIRFYRKGANDD
jgi:hypothetical protein